MPTTASPDLAADLRLSEQMKQGSSSEHEQAENSEFISELLAGRINEAGYIAYLQRLRIVYDALERASRALADDPQVSLVHDPALERVATIDADLAHWSARGGIVPEPVDSPAADAYAARITESASRGGHLVAHHYTRYLGDLSGGQAIGRLLDREFELGGEGVSMYSFELATANKPYKDAYRAKLDAIGDSLSAADRERIVDEVRVAFRLNQQLFAELVGLLDDYRR
ncbi:MULTISPECIES: heme oxygenase (biliverdin-producing) [Gordonia]|uniref:heme oxygenase (biliverdin-producing) n=1 Tax=Gordonia cholesterolivorans TaxID=559625 RepID=A0ABN3GZR3_9ACTN|nr:MULTISPECIES: biliverdin-producing heme oxygenase [Gordonia]KJR06942.1 heme oxygenase [Gordonia sihwensis]KXT56479.1 heme oxygenase [Gordonia sp. QH-12]